MKALKLKDGDFVKNEAGEWEANEGKDEILQEIKHSIQLWLGEFFIEPDEGVNWKKILQDGDTVLLRAEITKILDRNPRITRIRRVEILEFNRANRALKVRIEATADESIILSDALQIPSLAEVA